MQAAGTDTLCDEPTSRAASRHFSFAEGTLLTVKGKQAPLLVHRLQQRIEASPRPSSPHSTIFERDTECQALSDAMERLAIGQGGVVMIEAEPGAGKSLLLNHASDVATHRGHAAFSGAGQSIERETSYFAFRSILAQVLGLDEAAKREPAAAARRVVTALQGSPLLARAAVLEDIIPLDLLAFGQGEAVAPTSRREVVADIVAALLTEAIKTTGVVITIDDMHWIDPSSAHLVSALTRRLPSLLICLATRPLGSEAGTHVRTLVGLTHTRLPLRRLAIASTAELIRAVLGVKAVSHRVVEFVQSRTEGLPLFAEQW
jgi:predicted ATPase